MGRCLVSTLLRLGVPEAWLVGVMENGANGLFGCFNGWDKDVKRKMAGVTSLGCEWRRSRQSHLFGVLEAWMTGTGLDESNVSGPSLVVPRSRVRNEPRHWEDA